MTPRTAMRLLGLVLPLLICGAGCRSNYKLLSSAAPTCVVIYEGKVQRFHNIAIAYSEGGRVHEGYLVERIPDDTQTQLSSIVHYSPDQLRGTSIHQQAVWYTNDQPADRIRWVVGVDPVIVAIGGPAQSRRSGELDVRFVSDNDMEQPVYRVLRGPWTTYTDADPNALHVAPPLRREGREYDPPLTLRTVYESALRSSSAR